MSVTNPGPMLIAGLACVLLAVLLVIGVIILIASRRSKKLKAAKRALRQDMSELSISMGRVKIERH